MDRLIRLFQRHRTPVLVVAAIAVLAPIVVAISTPNGVPFDELKPGMVIDLQDDSIGEEVKVVKVEPEGVHVVLNDSTESVDLGDGVQASMNGMHLPISQHMWDSMKSRRVSTEKVTPAELEGYRAWRSGSGQYFDE